MRKERRTEIRARVETTEFLRETFEYDPRGWLVWRTARGKKIRAGDIAGSHDPRSGCNWIGIDGVGFLTRRLIWLWHGRAIGNGNAIVAANRDQADDRIENLAEKQQRRKPKPDRSAEKDVDLLRSLFAYDPSTGVLTWKVSVGTTRSGTAITGDRVKYNRVSFLAHRVAFVIHHGRPISDGMMIDHVNGDHRDNRAANLREATNSQNQANAHRRQDKVDGMPKGVWLVSAKGKFVASIKVNGKSRNLGYYATPAEAGEAYAAAAKELFGEFACLDR